MAVCDYCTQEMMTADTCTDAPIVIDGVPYQPVPYGREIGWGRAQQRCGDCLVLPGRVHHHGCDVEECPACGQQSITCDCVWAGDYEDEFYDDPLWEPQLSIPCMPAPAPPVGIGPAAAGVESGMSPGHSITVTPSDSYVEVRVAGHLLASTDRALILHETGLPDRYYLPREDVRMDLLRETSFHTTCPFKGEASYWSLDVDGHTEDGVVWSYEAPIPSAAEIEGMMCFYPDRAEVRVDGQLVAA